MLSGARASIQDAKRGDEARWRWSPSRAKYPCIAFVFYLIYNGFTMKSATTIRLDKKLKKQIVDLAKKYGLTFSDIVNMVLRAVADEEIHVGITQYPPGYIAEIEKRAEETYQLYKQGKIKGYTDPDEAMKALLKEAEQCD